MSVITIDQVEMLPGDEPSPEQRAFMLEDVDVDDFNAYWSALGGDKAEFTEVAVRLNGRMQHAELRHYTHPDDDQRRTISLVAPLVSTRGGLFTHVALSFEHTAGQTFVTGDAHAFSRASGESSAALPLRDNERYVIVGTIDSVATRNNTRPAWRKAS